MPGHGHAHCRLSCGSIKALTFTYEHDSGVDTELVARVHQYGLRAGGEFGKPQLAFWRSRLTYALGAESTQNSFPSGSARTTHDAASPWPTSTRRAP